MKEPFAKNEVKIAVIGGGTGSFTMLSALKNYTTQIAAIVSMADDGSSTGILRDELGTLPAGDVRQCLVALSGSPKIRELFEYRFDAGTFNGHSFGNVLLTALEKISGDFGDAVETASEILRINGVVIPATLDNVRLKMEWADKSLILNGERVIDTETFLHDPRQATLSLTPDASANQMALSAIEQADIVVISPGDLYTSLGPLLVIDGFGDALRKTKAKKFYVSNLVSKQGQTDGFTVSDLAGEIERFAGGPFLDYVLYNQEAPSEEVAKRYEEEGAYVTMADTDTLSTKQYEAVGGNFLGAMAEESSADTLIAKRSLIRHEPKAVAKLILKLYRSHEA
ncbi:MAG: uridine diphosphate-N-acetylglucosamine-binding protein YvcK [Patescibacteria group bacterium]